MWVARGGAAQAASQRPVQTGHDSKQQSSAACSKAATAGHAVAAELKSCWAASGALGEPDGHVWYKCCG